MSSVLLLILLVLAVGILLVFPRKRSRVEALIEELDSTEDDIELAEAEEEVRNLDALASPEDAMEALPDWGPGVPRNKKGKRS